MLIGGYALTPCGGTLWIRHPTVNDAGEFPLPLFEAEVSPLSQLSERDAERVERFYAENF